MAFPMLALAYDTNGLFIGQSIETGDVKACVAGSSCGGTLLGTITGNAGSKNPPYAHGVKGYFGLYGTGQFDGQGSGHDFWGTVSDTTQCCFQSFWAAKGLFRSICGFFSPKSIIWICVHLQISNPYENPYENLNTLTFLNYVMLFADKLQLQVYYPPHGNVNNCDGLRSHTYCDYRYAQFIDIHSYGVISDFNCTQAAIIWWFLGNACTPCQFLGLLERLFQCSVLA